MRLPSTLFAALRQSFNNTSDILCNRPRSVIKQNVSINLWFFSATLSQNRRSGLGSLQRKTWEPLVYTITRNHNRLTRHCTIDIAQMVLSVNGSTWKSMHNQANMRCVVVLVFIGVTRRGPRGPWPTKMFSIYSHFALWEVISETK